MNPVDAPPAPVIDDIEAARRLDARRGWAGEGYVFPGCGCGEGSKGVWLDVPEFVFHDDCCLHDYLYNLGGTEADRKEADLIFYQAMKRSAIKHGDDLGLLPLDRLSYLFAAWVYYRAVRLFGKRFFNYTKG